MPSCPPTGRSLQATTCFLSYLRLNVRFTITQVKALNCALSTRCKQGLVIHLQRVPGNVLTMGRIHHGSYQTNFDKFGWQDIITTLQKLDTNSSNRLKVITLFESELLKSHLTNGASVTSHMVDLICMCKAVFQARSHRPDQDKTSFLYLTIPAHSAILRPKRVRFIGENNKYKICLCLHFDKSIFIPRDRCVGVNTSNTVECSIVAFQVLTPV